MINFVCGMAFGIFLATAGTTGIAKLIDKSVNNFQGVIKESVQEQPASKPTKLESI
jgi:hypothetical protein